jgi:hypothetical protein
LGELVWPAEPSQGGVDLAKVIECLEPVSSPASWWMKAM